MNKTVKRETELVDDCGAVWVMATLSAARIKALIKEYKKLGIFLDERKG